MLLDSRALFLTILHDFGQYLAGFVQKLFTSWSTALSSDDTIGEGYACCLLCILCRIRRSPNRPCPAYIHWLLVQPPCTFTPGLASAKAIRAVFGKKSATTSAISGI